MNTKQQYFVEQHKSLSAWVKLNCLRNGVERFHLSMHKSGLVPLAKFKCGDSEQTADHVLIKCLTHRAPRGVQGLTVLDDKT